MKNKKISRIIISLFLLLIVAAGLVPSSAITAKAAMPTDDASWTVLTGDGKKGQEKYAQLNTLMSRASSGTKYIRLGTDIKFEYCSNKDGKKVKLPSLTPVGDVVLDLNGHTIDITNWYKKKERTRETMFIIESGTRLTVIDSQGKGKIHTDSYISAPEDISDPNAYDIFLVKGGELVIAASGAEFECGRSKKQWVMSNYYTGAYHGYARNQACGSVIVVEDDSKVTIAGGAFRARGYYSLTEGGITAPCAVIRGGTAKNVTVNILDGTFYGKGNAGVLQLRSDAKVTIRSGKFDTFQLDKVVCSPILGGEYDGVPTISGQFSWSTEVYGTIGIPDGALDPDNADVIVGGHNYSEDENEKDYADDTKKATTIIPKSNTKTPDKRIEISREDGVNAWNPSEETEFWIETRNSRAYFSDADRKFLEDDLQTETWGYYLWNFTLYDATTGKACDAQPVQIAGLSGDETKRFNIASFTDKSGKTPFDFKGSGISSYKVKVEMEEHWEGEHSYTSKFFSWYNFTLTEIDVKTAAQVMDADITPTEGTTNYNRYVLETLTSDDAMEFYFETGVDVFCDAYYQFYTLDSGGNTVRSSRQNIVTNLAYGDKKIFTIGVWNVGPIQVTVDYKFMHADGKTYDVVSVTKPVFALGALNYKVVGTNDKEETVLRDGTVYNDINKVKLNEGESVIIEPGFPSRVSAFDVVDPKTGKIFDVKNIKWQSCVASDIDGNDIWSDVPASDIVTREIDGIKTPCVKTNRSARYRVSYTWAGQQFSTAQTLNLDGVSYSKNRQATLTSGKSANIYGNGNQFTVTLNREADWFDNGSTMTQIQIKNVAKPDGAKIPSAKNYRTFEGIEDTRTFSVNSDDFFENANKVTAGEYSFYAIISGKNANGSSYQVTSPVCTVYYANAATDITLKVDGNPIYKSEEAQTPYFLPADANKFQFTYEYFPEGSTPETINTSTFQWSSSNPDILSVNSRTGEAEAKTPGTVTVTLIYYPKDSTQKQSRTAKVIVPIAGFQLKDIDYAAAVGKNPSKVKAEVESVWSYRGEKILKNPGSYLTATLTSMNGWGTGSVNFQDDVVQTNTDKAYGWTIAPTQNYFFPVKAETYERGSRIQIDYCVDTELLQCNGLERGELAPASSYDAVIDRNTPYQIEVNLADKTYTEHYTGEKNKGIRLTHTPRIDDPDAIYLKEVNITVSEPSVGDNRYEGTTYKPMNEYLVLNVSGLLGGRKTDNSHSYVAKLDLSKLKGTGKAYDNAAGEDLSEYMSVWNTADYVTWNKPTKRYEAGVYVHDVTLYFDPVGDGTDGQKIYVSKDANVYVNGRKIDYAAVQYQNSKSSIGYGNSIVSFDYYFDVGQVETVTEAEVTGIQTPYQGTKPSKADDVIIKTGGSVREDIYATTLQWFVDVNENGKYDSGEEVKVVKTADGKYNAKKSTLWYDGTFLPGVEYSAYVEFAGDEVRLDSDISVNFTELKKTKTGTSAVLSFPADQYIRTISIVTSTGEDAADPAKRDPMGLADANPGYTTSFEVYKHKAVSDAASDAAVSTFYQGSDISDKKLSGGKHWLKLTFTVRNEAYQMAKDVRVLVNGVDYGEEFATGRKNIVVDRSSAQKAIAHYCFLVPGTVSSGAEVSGTVTSFGTATDDVTVQFIESGTTEAAYEAVVKGNSAAYGISDVAAGTYTMKVMKKNHVTREYTVTVGTEAVTQDAEIWLLGDVTGDGKVTAKDNSRLYAHVLKEKPLW